MCIFVLAPTSGPAQESTERSVGWGTLTPRSDVKRTSNDFDIYEINDSARDQILYFDILAILSQMRASTLLRLVPTMMEE